MTLERHRSKFMPDIDFGGDGNLFVTDREGTFPLRGAGQGGKKRNKDPRINYNQDPATENDDARTFASYDPRRDRDKRRRYRPHQSQYEREVNQLSGTWSSGGTASVQRRVRRNRDRDRRHTDFQDDEVDRPHSYQPRDPIYPNYMGTMSSIGKKKKQTNMLRLPDYPGSLNRSKAAKSLDMKAIEAYNRNMQRVGKAGSRVSNRPPSLNGSLRKIPIKNGAISFIHEQPSRKKIAEERLPAVFFIVLGMLLAPLAVVKILFSFWHQYFAHAWTAALLLLLGILGITHKGDYLTKWKNGLYILVGTLASFAAGATCCLIFYVEVPVMSMMTSSNSNTSKIAYQVLFTNKFKSVVSSALSLDQMVKLSLGVDIVSMLLCLAGFFALTAALMAVSNHWDAVYDTTSVCDHRGKPRFFNPIEQIGLGHTTVVMGMLCILLSQTTQPHYYTPVYCGGLVMLAGMFGMFHGKRMDITSLGLSAMLMEFLALAACSAATVFVTLMLVDEIAIADRYQNTLKDRYRPAVVGSVAQSIFLFVMMFNVVFVVGVLFRQLRKVCCAQCDSSDRGVA